MSALASLSATLAANPSCKGMKCLCYQSDKNAVVRNQKKKMECISEVGLAYSTWVGMMELAEEVKSALRGTSSGEEERNIACSTHEASLVLPPCSQASFYPLDQALFRYKLLASAYVSLDDPEAQSDESSQAFFWGGGHV